MATGIIEKNNNGLFANEVELNGKYATITRHLKDDLGIFDTYRDVYITAALLGYLHKKSETEDTAEKVQPASIFAEAFNKKKRELRFLYRIIMLTKDEPDFTIDDYMNRTFRDDAEESNTDNLKKNMELFHSYVCGGLTYLQEKFGGLDRIEDIVDEVYNLVHEFAIDMELLNEEGLPDFVPEFD